MDSTPVVPPTIPPKPFKISKWLVDAIALFAMLYLIISLLHIPGPHAGAKPVAQQPASALASPLDVGAFNRARQQKFMDIAKKRELLKEEIKNAGLVDEAALLDILNHLPPCNKDQRETLNGQNYVAVNQQTKQVVSFACETDDSWHPLPAAAAAIAPTTPQQDNAIQAQRRQNNNNGGDGMSAGDKAASALDAALKSSSVVDFTVAQQTESPNVSSLSDARVIPATEHVDSDVEGKDPKRRYDWATYSGPLYWVFEGDIIEGILTNRLTGEYTGPLSVMVTTNLYSHDRQHILMPQGTRILGEASKVSMSGQRRLAVTFNRGFMPDGFPVDFYKLAGLDQQGAAGLTGRVDTHWPKVIATSALVGAIGGLSQIGASGTSIGGIDAIRLGVGQQTGQEAMEILSRSLNTLPTVTVYEGTRVRIWVQRDFQLPAYEKHTISPSL